MTFENCPDPICADGSTQKQITDMIGKSCDQIEGALRWIKSFIIPMSSYDMIPDEQLQAGLKKSKLVPRGKEVIAKSDLFGARDILERAKKKCDEGFTVECIACCDEDEAPAYVRTPFWGLWYGDIVLCLNKFCNLNARDQQSKLLHEITHYGGSSDTPSEGVIGADDLERDVPALAESPGK
ncbi:MAG: hypothetical protein HYY16_09105 [Planctomycetes bacterium]|nr:hypothetical protein [Planctomycetota bacterium]